MELFTKTCPHSRREESTHIVFGGIPSLLHIHDVDVKDRPELHLHEADQSAATLGALQKELLIHENNRQNSIRSQRGGGGGEERKFRKKRSCSELKSHRRQDPGASKE